MTSVIDPVKWTVRSYVIVPGFPVGTTIVLHAALLSGGLGQAGSIVNPTGGTVVSVS